MKITIEHRNSPKLNKLGLSETMLTVSVGVGLVGAFARLANPPRAPLSLRLGCPAGEA